MRLYRDLANLRRHGDGWFWLALAGITILAAILRLYALAHYPAEFQQDEMVLGYDAWSIWTTGRDHHGVWMPVYFRTFNDYVPPVANYLAAPFVGLLGLSEFTTRLPFALLGIATVVLVAVLGRLWFGRAAGLIAALLLAVEPWHLLFSRRALPESPIPFFTVAALLCFSLGINRLSAQDAEKPLVRRSVARWLVLSAGAFALLTGTYAAMKIEAPALVVACALAAAPTFTRHRRVAVGWLLVYLYCISPLVIAQLVQWSQVQTRFNALSILHQAGWVALFFTQYAEHFDPSRLFFTGYAPPSAIRAPGVGLLFWLEWPLGLAGLAGLLQRHMAPRFAGLRLPALLLLWLLTFPIASSLTSQDVPNQGRAYNLVPLPELLAGYGAVLLWARLRRVAGSRGAATRAVAASSAALLLVAFCALFLSALFAPSPLETRLPPTRIPYNVGLAPALGVVAREATPCDTIWMDYGNQAYMYYLFLTRYPPARFQRDRVVATTQDYWQVVLSFGNVHFGPPGSQAAPIPSGCAGRPVRDIFVTRGAVPGPNWTQLFAIRNAAGVPVWRVLVRPRP